ncbi:MAG: hypothetical protein IIZ48_08325 [Erysipelotrichales bacterium]|nr:hypothetical protein [Erysipelotrichales bacterium]
MTSKSVKYDKKFFLKAGIPIVFLIGCLILFAVTELAVLQYHWYVRDVSDSFAKSDRLYRATDGKEGTYAYYKDEVCIVTLESSNMFFATLISDAYTRPATGNPEGEPVILKFADSAKLEMYPYDKMWKGARFKVGYYGIYTRKDGKVYKYLCDSISFDEVVRIFSAKNNNPK